VGKCPEKPRLRTFTTRWTTWSKGPPPTQTRPSRQTCLKDWLKTRGDSGSLRTLRIVAEFEETQDDEEGLEQFKRWLQAKGNHPHVVMALWWIAEFTESENKDPPRWPLTPQLH
jgi:hypothetical protein